MLIYNEVFTSLGGGYMPVLMIIFLLFGVLTGYLTRGGKRSRILGMAIPAGIFVLAELMYFLNLQIFSSGDGYNVSEEFYIIIGLITLPFIVGCAVFNLVSYLRIKYRKECLYYTDKIRIREQY